jgi:hypothetical protein
MVKLEFLLTKISSIMSQYVYAVEDDSVMFEYQDYHIHLSNHLIIHILSKHIFYYVDKSIIQMNELISKGDNIDLKSRYYTSRVIYNVLEGIEMVPIDIDGFELNEYKHENVYLTFEYR